jgi:hypothetical protein
MHVVDRRRGEPRRHGSWRGCRQSSRCRRDPTSVFGEGAPQPIIRFPWVHCASKGPAVRAEIDELSWLQLDASLDQHLKAHRAGPETLRPRALLSFRLGARWHKTICDDGRCSSIGPSFRKRLLVRVLVVGAAGFIGAEVRNGGLRRCICSSRSCSAHYRCSLLSPD